MAATLQITIDGAAAEPLRFAAAELQRYLAAITGSAAEVRSAQLSGQLLVLGPLPERVPEPPADADGFVIEPTAAGAVISGASPRAVLHGVYALLEQQGCRWSLHGRAHEVVPRLPALAPIRAVRVQPRFEVCGYSADIMTWHYADAAHLSEHLEADCEFIDWMGKSGANAYLLIRHPFDSQLTIPELVPEFNRRGIAAEYGGHVIPLLLPRELFARHPEYFPCAAGGARSEFGNLCTANAGALRLATENAVRYVREYPELSVLHIWGADLWDGGWCHCAACAGVTVQDQSLRLCNAVATALAEQGEARPVCYLAYHDTIAPELQLRPAENVYVEFAPRERCYAHALDDPCCAANRRYRRALEGYAERFDGRVRFFEYYADAILFCGCALPLGEVIAADLDYYHRLGIRQITNLQFGAFSLWAYPLNFLAYAAAARSRRCDLAQVREQYAEGFSRQRDLAAAALRELETIMGPVVTYGDIRRPPLRPRAAAALRPRLESAIQRLGRLAEALAPALEPGGELVALQAQLRYNAAVLAGVGEQLAGRDPRHAYERALAIMENVERRFKGLWGAENLPVIHAYHDAAIAEARG
ncbi:MAG: DUF4838 domain-containing protein [Deltaproteobacteria bacterium]|nr:DUF4838 domain-containing protein [Deltaproteobacteria bacterium]